jgi:CBS domain-containing protein
MPVSATAGSIMSTPVVTARRDASLPAAERIMRGERIRHLPVVDRDDRLVGVLSRRDLLAARQSSLLGSDDERRTDLELEVRIDRIMTRDVWTVAPDAPLTRLAREMVARRVSCAPAVSSDGRPIGIVTSADLLGSLITRLGGAPPIEIATIMTAPAFTVRGELPLGAAAERMVRLGVRHLPVVDDDGALVALLSDRDLLAAARSSLAAAERFGPWARVVDAAPAFAWAIAPSTTAFTAARLLRDHSIGCLPIVENDRVVGIVSEIDLIALLPGILDAERAAHQDAPVGYYMSEPIRSVEFDAPLERARALLGEHAVSGLAVVSEGDALLGVVTQVDLLRSIDALQGRVADVMSRSVEVVQAWEPVVVAAQRLGQLEIHRLVVVDGARPVGMLTVTDLTAAVRDFEIARPLAEVMTPVLLTIEVGEPVAAARRFLDQAGVTGILVTERGEPAGVFSRAEALAAGDAGRSLPVGRIMSRRFLRLPPETPLGRAAGEAAAAGASRVLVVGPDGPIGIVTGTDFAAALAELAPRSERSGWEAHALLAADDDPA